MNALAIPISSRTAEDMSSACFLAKSPRIREARSATCWLTFASSSASELFAAGCISHDAIIALGTLCAPGVVKVVQVCYRLTHREEGLVRVERAPEQHRQQFRCTPGFLLQRFLDVLEAI